VAKFKSGDNVIYNGNHESYVLNYYTDKMVEVRIWRGQRHVGDVCVHEDDLILKEVA
jgi:hypothetical protein